jgi:hypothetical protein
MSRATGGDKHGPGRIECGFVGGEQAENMWCDVSVPENKLGHERHEACHRASRVKQTVS